MSSDTASLPTQDQQSRFFSLASLKEANNGLLKRRRHEENTLAFLKDVKEFVEKVHSTGTILNVEDERWTGQSLLDYWLNFLCRASVQIPDSELTLAPFDPALAPVLDESKRPYLGLAAFRETMHSIFFGRQKLIEELSTKLKRQRFLAVIGPSGSGKSSLVRAGLLPTLRGGSVLGSRKWRYYPPIVPGSEQLTSLALLVQPDSSSEWIQQQINGFKQNPGHLLQLINQDNSEPALVIVDQFEEVFTLTNDETLRAAFIDNLLQLVEYPDLRHTVIITMRSDFESYVAKIPKLQSFFAQGVRVTPLTAAELREAIEKPAQQVGLKFEEGIVNELVTEVLGEPAGLPLLQFTLLKLWDHRRHNLVTWEAFHQLGSCREALTRSADKFYNELSALDQLRVKWILLQLVRPGEGFEVFSNRVPRDTLYSSAEAREYIDNVLDKLIEAGLVRETDSTAPGEVKVEVAHEALVRHWRMLVAWLEEERVNLRKRLRLREAAKLWDASGRDSSQLLRGSLLDEALRYDDLGKLEEVFVKKSLSTQRRTRRTIILAAVTTFVVLAILATFSYYQARAARAAERKAFSRQLAAQALNNKSRLDLALLLSLEAYRINPTVEAGSSLLTLLETQSPGLVTYLQNSASPALSLSFSNNSTLTSLNSDGTINTWDINQPQVRPKPIPTQIAEEIITSAPSLDGKAFAISTRKGEVVLIDSATGQNRWRFTVAQDEGNYQNIVQSLAFSSDGRILAIVNISYDDSPSIVTLLDVAAGSAQRALSVKPIVRSIAFSKDSKMLALGTIEDHIILMEIATGRQYPLKHEKNKDESHSFDILSFSPDDKLLASWDDGGTITLWDVKKHKSLFEITKGKTEDVNSLVFKDNETLVSSADDGDIVIWDLNLLDIGMVTPESTFSASSDKILSLAFSPDGKTMVSSNIGKTVIVWDTEIKGRLSTKLSIIDSTRGLNFEPSALSPFNRRFFSAAFSPDGKLLASGTDKQTIILWDAASRQPVEGGSLVAPVDETTVRHDSQKYVSPLRRPSMWTLDLTFNRNGKLLGARYGNGKAIIWDVTGRVPVFQIDEAGRTVEAIAVSPDETLVAWGSEKTRPQNKDLPPEERAATLTLKNFASEQSPRLFSETGGDSVMSVAFSPDGKILASGTANSMLTLWDTQTGAPVALLGAGHGKSISSLIRRDVGIQSLAFSPDGKILAAGNMGNTITLWDVASRKPLGPPMRYGSMMKKVTFSPDGKILASASVNGIILWDVSTQQLLCRIPLSTSSFISSNISAVDMAYSPDSQFLAIASGLRNLTLWDARLTSWMESACRTANRNLSEEEWAKYMSANPDHDKYHATCPDLPVGESASINSQP